MPVDSNGTSPSPRRGTHRRGTTRRKRLLITLATLLTVALVVVAGWLLFGQDAAEESAQQTPSATPTATEDEEDEPDELVDESGPIRIMAMGDMLPHDSVHSNAQTSNGWDYGQFFTGIQDHLDQADAIFCNQEVPSAGESFGITGYPVFNAPIEFAEDLRSPVGCDLINLANNHTADYGFDGIEATREVWDTLDPVSISGANRSAEEQNEIVYGEIDGITTALVSFAEYSNASIDGTYVNFLGDTDLVERLMNDAREHADLVLVSAHWGTEDSHVVNDYQRANAQRLADLGADVILGTGPHVLQETEWLDRADGGETLVWYSLGNMLNTQLNLPQLTSVIASFEVVPGEGDEPVTVQNPTALPTYMHYEWTPEQEAAGDLLARTNLSIQPLADSAELLERARFGTTPDQLINEIADILGPAVTLETG